LGSIVILIFFCTSDKLWFVSQLKPSAEAGAIKVSHMG
jgi:hypothetical protein